MRVCNNFFLICMTTGYVKGGLSSLCGNAEHRANDRVHRVCIRRLQEVHPALYAVIFGRPALHELQT